MKYIIFVALMVGLIASGLIFQSMILLFMAEALAVYGIAYTVAREVLAVV